jgi:hypothetical protein
MVLRQEGWSDGSSGLKAALRVHAAATAVPEVEVGLNGIQMNWDRGAIGLCLQAMRRKIGRDGVWRCR